ncbi:DNA (cytosine-5)-methyltransferase 1 [Halotydeus destructor]|nr:DNA (cytosine-5)-methyltransferase 1 [Halotydeus destructor]
MLRTKRAIDLRSDDLLKRLKSSLKDSLDSDKKCETCKQLLSDCVEFRQKLHHVDELQVLTKPELISQGHDQKDISAVPQYRLDGFSIYGSCRHFVSIDANLIENGDEVCVEGVVKPLFDENSTRESERLHIVAGPITEWWFSGFDGSNKVLLGVESPLASYILEKPSTEYKPYIEGITDKLYISKLVIEFLNDATDATFEELLEAIHERSCDRFDEETLLRHSNFVVSQVLNYDESAEEDEPKLLETTAMKYFIALSGARRAVIPDAFIVRKDARRASNSDARATSTPLVRTFFDEIFGEVLETKGNNSKRKRLNNKSKTKSKPCDATVSWLGRANDRRNALKVGDVIVTLGDFISFKKTTNRVFQTQIGQIKSMFESRHRTKNLHIQLFRLGNETILGETSDPRRIYALNECCDIDAANLFNKVEVIEIDSRTVNSILPTHLSKTAYLCDKLYQVESGAFVDIPLNAFCSTRCLSCSNREDKSTKLISLIKEEGKVEYYHSLEHNGLRVSCNDFILLKPTLIVEDHFTAHLKRSINCDKSEASDEYPEIYRKQFTEVVKGSYVDPTSSLLVGRVTTIRRNSDSRAELEVVKLLRDENLNTVGDMKRNVKELFYTTETIVVPVDDVVSVTQVFSDENHLLTDAFFCKLNVDGTLFQHQAVKESDNKNSNRKLRTLDLFAGCEKDNSAAESFANNFPDSVVFKEDVNQLLKQIISGESHNSKGQKFPLRGEVDLILAGPPCQGFSGMNRFSSGQYSQFKNSLIVTSLSFVDYYRPDFVIIENVKNFFKFNKCMVLKLTLACLLKMNYQVRFGVLQAGFYGVPQARKRAIIIAAAPGKVLPTFPQPLTSFSARLAELWTMVDGKKYYSGVSTAGLYRTLTIADAISDLNTVKPSRIPDEGVPYDLPPNSSFQEYSRLDKGDLVFDHCCKVLGELTVARIERIPKRPGADWRDLPNVEVVLPSGEMLKKLIYSHPDNRLIETAAMRGVCSCASGNECCPKARQERTLIPWCLVHTANKNYHWSGLYGRLNWDGYFATTVTNPEPISKQGMIIHPEQDRILTIRECARSQGFPDSFRFSGSVNDRYRQIGNAVPVPLAWAIANEFTSSCQS